MADQGHFFSWTVSSRTQNEWWIEGVKIGQLRSGVRRSWKQWTWLTEISWTSCLAEVLMRKFGHRGVWDDGSVGRLTRTQMNSFGCQRTWHRDAMRRIWIHARQREWERRVQSLKATYYCWFRNSETTIRHYHIILPCITSFIILNSDNHPGQAHDFTCSDYFSSISWSFLPCQISWLGSGCSCSLATGQQHHRQGNVVPATLTTQNTKG